MILKKMLAVMSAVTLSFSAVSGCFPSMSSSKHTFRAMAEEIEFSNNEELVLVTDSQKTDTETKNTDDGLSYYFEGDEIIINGYSGSSKKVVIPETIDGIAVTTVSDYAFNGNTVITGIDLGNVKSIGGKAFAGCTELKEITIPKTVTQAGDWKYGCLEGSSIEKVVFEEGIASIPAYVCRNASSVKEVILPEKVDTENGYSIGEHAFDGTSVSSIKLPVSLTSIGNSVFAGCKNLKSISVP
ncbi:MAG: leucine-rich repeat domain-containing protein, partial [Ruminococcus sp.]|uniref:leucine-rich repeat domain-containing protein n=1 Tax=Ruminococcus sp. TaxID=41978 RepID=UPI001B207FC3